jgi:hypothetical protein
MDRKWKTLENVPQALKASLVPGAGETREKRNETLAFVTNNRLPSLCTRYTDIYTRYTDIYTIYSMVHFCRCPAPPRTDS